MKIAAKPDNLERIRELYGERVAVQVAEKVGDKVIVDFWDDTVLGKPAVWFRCGLKTDFVRL